MKKYILSMISMTDSQRSKKLLNKNNIPVQITALDKSLTQRGCAFGIIIPDRSVERATQILDKEGLFYGELLKIDH